MTVLTVPPRPKGRWMPWTAASVVVAVTVFMCLPVVGVGLDVAAIARNWQQGALRVGELLTPDWSFFPRTVGPILETLQMAVIGTAVGAAISLPVSFWAARPTNPFTPTRAAVRGILNVVRAVPELVYAAVLVAMVGVGALPGILALVLFNVGIIVKLVSESIDATDLGPLEAGRAAGATQTQINRAIALPDTWPAFVSQTLYVFELNVRASTVLGLVGAGGIGLLIDAVRTFYRYDQLSLVIVEILVIVVVLDTVSDAIRRRLV
ncbi:phosphonate transport system permease protein [Microbacterium sp. AG157]|uniref:phosphonate ABC transporter, permease protein PhnE n=1 Tax=Microbacterium TaxID=33882 RepID=UPI000CCF35B6|nr:MULTISPECIES: phosphonate ABC transporter, permease protein PhnE [Microbacterium]PNW10391.1 phosphonate ABC transporter, permease protein PhnE [Microbacterium testaceum]REC98648.1 phosphonate transport system permease protein [Microbacterium sp. AG157]WJS90233.1 phosphonate ABC transporter, permease protein PhnE [Microbacterium testaceum]